MFNNVFAEMLQNMLPSIRKRSYSDPSGFNPFAKDDWFYFRDSTLISFESTNSLPNSNPRYFYKKIMICVDALSIQTLFFKAAEKAKVQKEIREYKKFYEENYRLYAKQWTLDEKEKVNGAYSMLELAAFLHKFDSDNFSISDVDFNKLRDAFQGCLNNKAFTSLKLIVQLLIPNFKNFHLSKILKFLMMFAEENFKNARNSPLIERFKDPDVSSHLQFDEAILNQEIFLIENKLNVLQFIFTTSIKALTESLDYAELDDEKGDLFMATLKGIDFQDPEFAAIPSIIGVYETAEKTAKFISKLSKQRYDLFDKNQKLIDALNKLTAKTPSFLSGGPMLKSTELKRKEYYMAFVYYATAKFHTNENVRYKMLKKSVTDFESVNNSADSFAKEALCKILPEGKLYLCDGYGDLWKIKYKNFLKNPTEADWDLVKQLAQRRVTYGNEMLENWEHIWEESQRFPLLYDMVKANLWVLKNRENAEKCAAVLLESLFMKPKYIDLFQKMSGVRINRKANVHKSMLKIIDSCKI